MKWLLLVFVSALLACSDVDDSSSPQRGYESRLAEATAQRDEEPVVRGFVVCRGDPVPCATVTSHGRGGESTAQTGADGAFSLGGGSITRVTVVAPGFRDVTAHTSADQPTIVTMTPEGEPDEDVGAWHVRLVDPEGRACVGATLEVNGLAYRALADGRVWLPADLLDLDSVSMTLSSPTVARSMAHRMRPQDGVLIGFAMDDRDYGAVAPGPIEVPPRTMVQWWLRGGSSPFGGLARDATVIGVRGMGTWMSMKLATNELHAWPVGTERELAHGQRVQLVEEGSSTCERWLVVTGMDARPSASALRIDMLVDDEPDGPALRLGGTVGREIFLSLQGGLSVRIVCYGGERDLRAVPVRGSSIDPVLGGTYAYTVEEGVLSKSVRVVRASRDVVLHVARRGGGMHRALPVPDGGVVSIAGLHAGAFVAWLESAHAHAVDRGGRSIAVTRRVDVTPFVLAVEEGSDAVELTWHAR